MGGRINGQIVTDEQFASFIRELESAAQLSPEQLRSILQDREVTRDEVISSFDHRQRFMQDYLNHRLPTNALFTKFIPQMEQYAFIDIDFWRSFVTRNPGLWSYIPENVLEAHPEILDNALEQRPRLIFEIPENRIYERDQLTHLGMSLWWDRLFSDPSSLREAPPRLQRDREFILGLAHYRPEIVSHMEGMLHDQLDFILALGRTNVNIFHYTRTPEIAREAWRILVSEVDLTHEYPDLPPHLLENYSGFREHFLHLIGPHFLDRVHRLDPALSLMNTREQYRRGTLSNAPVFFVAATKDDYNGAFINNELIDDLAEDTRIQVITADLDNDKDIGARLDEFHRATKLYVHTLIVAAHSHPTLGMHINARDRSDSSWLSPSDASSMARQFADYVRHAIFFFGCSAGVALVKPFAHEGLNLRLLGQDIPTNVERLIVNDHFELEPYWSEAEARTIVSRGKPVRQNETLHSTFVTSAEPRRRTHHHRRHRS